MKRCIKYSLLFVSVLLVNVKLFAQDVQFSQFYTTKFNIAPSFAGTAEDGRLTLFFRDQWPMLKNAFLIYGFAADYSMSSLNGGVGVYTMQDYTNGGGFVTTNTGFQYSYAVELSPIWQFRPGLQISTINKKIDLNKLTFGSQLSFDGTKNDFPVNIETSSITYFEAATSVLFYSDIIWIGLNADHIPFTKNTFTGESQDIPLTFTSFGGVRMKKIQGRLLYDRSYLYFSYLFKYQDKSKQLDLGVYWFKKGLELGMWYRGLPFIKNSYGKYNNSAIIIKAGMEFDFFALGYSYDFSLSTTSFYTGGAHEVTVVYLFDLTDDLKKKKHKMVPSPRF